MIFWSRLRRLFYRGPVYRGPVYLVTWKLWPWSKYVYYLGEGFYGPGSTRQLWFDRKKATEFKTRAEAEAALPVNTKNDYEIVKER